MPSALKKNLPHIIALVVLVFILLFTLVHFHILCCADVPIPGFCGIYHSIVGTPRFAMITGTGAGDAEAFDAVIATETQHFMQKIPSYLVTDAGVLKNYQVMIVEGPKKMDTQTLWAIQKFVQGGGRLVWIGDAGTQLGDNDYICEPVEFAYLPSFEGQTGGDIYQCSDIANPVHQQKCFEGDCAAIDDDADKLICQKVDAGERKPVENTTVCAQEWITLPADYPDWLESGICGKTLGSLVHNYLLLKDQLTPVNLCQSVDEPFQTQGAERIEACIERLKSQGLTEEDLLTLAPPLIDANCSGMYNYWDRGPSYDTRTKQRLADPLDFSQAVLGFEYVDNYGSSNLVMTPIDTSHRLMRGYGGTSQFATTTNVTLVDTSRFASVARTNTLAQLTINREETAVNSGYVGRVWPAVITSNPTFSVGGSGSVIYYAFYPEDLTRFGGGITLVKNLFNYLENC